MKRIWYLKESGGTRTKAVKLLVYEKNEHLSGKLDLSAFGKEELILCFRNKGGEEVRLLGQEELSEEKARQLQEEKKEWELSVTEGKTAFLSQGFEENIESKQEESPGKMEEVQEETDIEAAEELDEWDEDQGPVNMPEGKRIVQLATLEDEMLFRDYVHNSFLLHGYYNYGHVILDETEEAPRLGVPGNYYEREQLVAQMFGFPDFEAAQDVEKVTNGTFGYFYTRG
ncbi:MAG: hypothetical protein J1E61_09865 [Lachnospiraceae bacterium]|nr:hypothetical protein [Lachnospiraceae bacterium]